MEDAEGSAYRDVWQQPPTPLKLSADEVHVWRIDLGSLAAFEQSYRVFLSLDEIERADCFLRAVHGQRFTIMRGALRRILGRYLGVNANTITFQYNEHGKPILNSKLTNGNVSFNVSHTDAHGVIAVCNYPSVGIDIERFRERLELEKLANRYFAPVEVSALMALPREMRERAFYRCWSSKEAFMKVVGQGLSIGLGNFVVEVNPENPVAVVNAPENLPDAGTWDCCELPMGEGLAGVLMVEGRLKQVRYFQFEG